MTRVLKGSAGKGSAVEKARYRYGPDGLRISKTTSMGTRYYVYGIDGNELSESAGAMVADTVWVLGKKFAEVERVTDAATGVVKETRTYLATDQVGSVVAATDESGKVIWQGSLTAFGEDGGEAGLAGRIASYTGKDFDEESGLTYFNARWYDAGLGRFTTEDPARDGVNWYAYCGNDPLGSTDPSGLQAGDPNGDIAGLAAAETAQNGKNSGGYSPEVGHSAPPSAGSPGTPTPAPVPAPAKPSDDLSKSPVTEAEEGLQGKSPGDMFFVSYDVEKGKAVTTYVSLNEDGTVDYNSITQDAFNFSNNVNTKEAGRDAPDGETIPADGSFSQYYDPVNAPNGLWSNGHSRASSNPNIQGPVVPTDATVNVPVYGPVTGTPPSRNAEPTGTQVDTGYNYHVATNPGRPSSAGCPITYGDQAVQEMTAFAAMNDAALESGGTSTSYWH